MYEAPKCPECGAKTTKSAMKRNEGICTFCKDKKRVHTGQIWKKTGHFSNALVRNEKNEN